MWRWIIRLLQEESRYIDSQTGKFKEILIDPSPRNKAKELVITLEDDLIDRLCEKDVVELTGILKTFKSSKDSEFIIYLYVNHINFLEKWGVDFNIDDDNDLDLEHETSRNSPEYQTWKKNVIARDKGVCQVCGLDKKLHVHHIFGYAHYPDLAYDVDNGITLCKYCHQKYATVFGNKNNTGINFVNFVKQFSVGSVVNQITICEDYKKDNLSYSSDDFIPYFAFEEKYGDMIKSIFLRIQYFEETQGFALIKEIKSECNEIFLTSDFVDKVIRHLKNKGLIYEFQSGKLRSVS